MKKRRSSMIYIDPVYRRLFNMTDDASRGRSMLLINTIIANFANVFISGSFYTGYLTQNGIDIVNVGIITFIPYFAWIFSLFAPSVLRHFKRRKGLLIFNHLFYYGCVVLATTVMPNFVTDPAKRTFWFGVFLLLGNLSNALIGSGSQAWFMHFIPADGGDRNVYFSVNNLASNLVSTVAAIGASVLTDALSGSPNQATVIVVLRYLAFALFVVEAYFVFVVPKEYPYELPDKAHLLDVIIKPIKCRKFMLTAVICIGWNLFCNFNASTWTYYVLNTVGISYSLTYTCTVVTAVCCLFMLGFWRNLIKRITWFRVLVLCVLGTAAQEFMFGFTTSKTIWLYVLVSIYAGFILVGSQLVFNNLFYLNLPKSDTDTYITFWNFITYISALLGQIIGTAFIGLVEKNGTVPVLGMEMYGSQLLVWLKCICLLGLCVYIVKITPHIQPDADSAMRS